MRLYRALLHECLVQVVTKPLFFSAIHTVSLTRLTYVAFSGKAVLFQRWYLGDLEHVS